LSLTLTLIIIDIEVVFLTSKLCSHYIEQIEPMHLAVTRSKARSIPVQLPRNLVLESVQLPLISI